MSVFLAEGFIELKSTRYISAGPLGNELLLKKKLMQVNGRILFLAGIGLKSTFSSWLLSTGDHFQLECLWPPPQVFFNFESPLSGKDKSLLRDYLFQPDPPREITLLITSDVA
jgi:hypothetical protein